MLRNRAEINDLLTLNDLSGCVCALRLLLDRTLDDQRQQVGNDDAYFANEVPLDELLKVLLDHLSVQLTLLVLVDLVRIEDAEQAVNLIS